MSPLNAALVIVLCCMVAWVAFGVELWARTGGPRKLRAALARWNWFLIGGWLGALALGLFSWWVLWALL